MLQPKLLLIEIPGAALMVAGLLAFWYQTRPTILPPSVSGDNEPLALPFTIKNESVLTFSDVTTRCLIDQMEWRTSDPTTLSAISDNHPQPGGNLGPGRSVRADCVIVMGMHNLSTLIRDANLIGARAQIVVNYKTWFLSREYESGHFCWVPTPPSGHQWAVCDTL
jgi:hypothetical protein